MVVDLQRVLNGQGHEAAFAANVLDAVIVFDPAANLNQALGAFHDFRAHGHLAIAGDVQGLADIGGSFERVYAMRLMPISLRTTLTFALAAALPMFPLVLAVMPLKDLLKILMQAMI